MKPTSQQLTDLLQRALEPIENEHARRHAAALAREIRETLAAVDASTSAKSKPERKPKIQIGRDTASLDDRGLRAYYKQNDLYYSACFHGERGNSAMLALAERVLFEGQTIALKREYLALYEAQQRQHRSWIMPGDGVDTRPEAIRADRTAAQWETIRQATRQREIETAEPAA